MSARFLVSTAGEQSGFPEARYIRVDVAFTFSDKCVSCGLVKNKAEGVELLLEIANLRFGDECGVDYYAEFPVQAAHYLLGSPRQFVRILEDILAAQ
jgi:hypothetical protein